MAEIRQMARRMKVRLENRAIESLEPMVLMSGSGFGDAADGLLDGEFGSESNRPPEFTNLEDSQFAIVEEGDTFIFDLDGIDPDGDPITFEIVPPMGGGLGMGWNGVGPILPLPVIEVDAQTGVVSFPEPPDFTTLNHLTTGVLVRVSDGQLFSERSYLRVEFSGANLPPTFDAPGFAVVDVVENNSFVTELNATDPEGATVTFEIPSVSVSDFPFDDSDLFSIDANTGRIEFRVPPDFEQPSDGNSDNSYSIRVRAWDGFLYREKPLIVRVTDDAGEIATSPMVIHELYSVEENTTLVGPQFDGSTAGYVLSGVDSELFQLDAVGNLSFRLPPDFESPQDVDRNNDYEITRTVLLPNGADTTEQITVRVTDVDESPSTSYGDGDDEIFAALGNNVIDGGDGEDTLVVYQGTSADFDIRYENDGRVIVEGPGLNGTTVRNELINVEQIRFLDRTVFLNEPNGGEPPATLGTDADDWIAVPERGGLVDAGAGDDSIYSPLSEFLNNIDGGDGGDTLVIYEGVREDYTVRRINDDAIELEGPGLNGTTVVNQITNVEFVHFLDGKVAVSELTHRENSSPSFTNLNDGEVIEVSENTTFIRDLHATDPDGDVLTYSTSDQKGAVFSGDNEDGDLFRIDPESGVLEFKAAPDFGDPEDSTGNNELTVTVIASDGKGRSQSRRVVVKINEVDSTLNYNVPENSTEFGRRTITGGPVVHSLSGDDAEFSEVLPISGNVSFRLAPDFEQPQDSDGDNVYKFERRGFSPGGTVVDHFTVRVTDVEESPSASYGDGDDEIFAALGNNVIDGGDGEDTLVVYQGTSADFDIRYEDDGRVIVEGPGLNGTTVRNELINVEQIRFLDRTVFLNEPNGGEPPATLGTDDDDWIAVPERGGLVDAGAGDDSIYSPLSEFLNNIDGGDGVDTLIIYEGVREDYTVRRIDDDTIELEGPGLNGTTVVNQLTNVESVHFLNGKVAVSELVVGLS